MRDFDLTIFQCLRFLQIQHQGHRSSPRRKMAVHHSISSTAPFQRRRSTAATAGHVRRASPSHILKVPTVEGRQRSPEFSLCPPTFAYLLGCRTVLYHRTGGYARTQPSILWDKTACLRSGNERAQLGGSIEWYGKSEVTVIKSYHLSRSVHEYSLDLICIQRCRPNMQL
jgi:hypothetical protein